MKRIAPGAYDDGEGGLHIDVGEFLAGHGIADTPANRATVVEEWREVFDGPVVEVDDPIPSFTCPRCGRTSCNLNDIREKYCGFCHVFTGDPE